VIDRALAATEVAFAEVDPLLDRITPRPSTEERSHS
jgi:hypothetical protein